MVITVKVAWVQRECLLEGLHRLRGLTQLHVQLTQQTPHERVTWRQRGDTHVTPQGFLKRVFEVVEAPCDEHGGGGAGQGRRSPSRQQSQFHLVLLRETIPYSSRGQLQHTRQHFRNERVVRGTHRLLQYSNSSCFVYPSLRLRVATSLVVQQRAQLVLAEPPRRREALQAVQNALRHARLVLGHRLPAYLVHAVGQRDPEEVSNDGFVRVVEHVQKSRARRDDGEQLLPCSPEERESMRDEDHGNVLSNGGGEASQCLVLVGLLHAQTVQEEEKRVGAAVLHVGLKTVDNGRNVSERKRWIGLEQVILLALMKLQ